MEHSPSVVADNYQLESGRWATGRNVLVFAALLSIIGCIFGYISEPERFFRSYLVAFSFTAAIGLGAFFCVMVQYPTGSAWSVVVRRIMENLMVTLPVGAILFIPIALGLEHLYPWMNTAFMAANRELAAKAGYLTKNFFLTRTYVSFAL